VIVEEAKFFNLETRKLFSTEKREFSWLLNGNESTAITTHAATRDIQRCLKDLLHNRHSTLKVGSWWWWSSVLIKECDVSEVPWEWQTTHALHKCILTYTYMYYHFNHSCREMFVWLYNDWRLHNPIHVP